MSRLMRCCMLFLESKSVCGGTVTAAAVVDSMRLNLLSVVCSVYLGVVLRRGLCISSSVMHPKFVI